VGCAPPAVVVVTTGAPPLGAAPAFKKAISFGPTACAMNLSPWLLGCTPSPASMALVKPAAREQSAMTMGDCVVVCDETQPGIALLTASTVASLQEVGISLSIYVDNLC
jgi:hypothetical protein